MSFNKKQKEVMIVLLFKKMYWRFGLTSLGPGNSLAVFLTNQSYNWRQSKNWRFMMRQTLART